MLKTKVSGYNDWGYITQEFDEYLNENEATEAGECLGIEMVCDVSYEYLEKINEEK